jgi:hypothetical protein
MRLSYDYLFEDANLFEIEWQDPILYDEVENNKNSTHRKAFLYMILGKHGSKFTMYYIGKTQGSIYNRLKMKDHVNRREHLEKEHSRHKLFVSIGLISSTHKIRSHLPNIEAILIYAHSTLPCIVNSKSTITMKVKNQYLILNQGFLAPDMHAHIHYGLFVYE